MKKIIKKIAVSMALAGAFMAQSAEAMFDVKTLKRVAPLVGVVGFLVVTDVFLDWYDDHTFQEPITENISDDALETEKNVMELEETFEELSDNKDVLKKNEIFCTDVHTNNFKLTLFGKVDDKIVAALSLNSKDMDTLDTNYTIEIQGLSADYAKSLADAFSTTYILNPGIQLTVAVKEDISEKFENKHPHDFVSCRFSVVASKRV